MHTNRDFNPLLPGTLPTPYTHSYLLMYLRALFENMHWIYQTCPKCDKKLIGMVITTGEVPTFRISPVGGLKTQNCPRKSAVTCAHTHTHCTWMHTCTHHLAYYTDGDFWRREHHGMFLSRGLKWYWGKIISPETKSRGLIFFPK